ncbi:hypothetical protein [Streptomyces sp. wa1063]|uniref:hypothetical protein n=1 Tax=Streptomyces sp. wa1063 TaxID=1828212 RepID=UPI000BF04B6B|nr:hypothetical protein [Streptomyces sp. wa1063]
MIRGRTTTGGDVEFVDSTSGDVVAAITADGVEGAAPGPVAWVDITGKPTTFAPTIGTTASTAVAGNDTRLTAGVAGVATVRAIGSTATTAAAGNHVHTATQVTATAISPGSATTVQGILAELAARITVLETP